MLEAAFWGFIAASALTIGAEVAFAFKLSRMAIGLVLAFGPGTLLSSIAFELVEPALALADGYLVALALTAGALVFFAGDRAIARMGGALSLEIRMGPAPGNNSHVLFGNLKIRSVAASQTSGNQDVI